MHVGHVEERGWEGGRMDCHWGWCQRVRCWCRARMDRCKSDCEMEMNESVQCIPLIPTYPKTIMVQTLQEWKWNTRTQANMPSEGEIFLKPGRTVNAMTAKVLRQGVPARPRYFAKNWGRLLVAKISFFTPSVPCASDRRAWHIV